MIYEIRKWCENLIIAIIISIIIETLIPENKNKKYVKIIIGIYIIFVILNPILQIFDYKIEEFELIKTEETISQIDNNIKDVYLKSIEIEIKNGIEELGYFVKNVKIYVDDKYQNIEKVELEIKGKGKLIEPVEINKNEEKKYTEIEEYLKEKYSIEKIIFK